MELSFSSIEWIRHNSFLRIGEYFEKNKTLFLVMDSVTVPNYDNKGEYLVMLQLIGEATAMNELPK